MQTSSKPIQLKKSSLQLKKPSIKPNSEKTTPGFHVRSDASPEGSPPRPRCTVSCTGTEITPVVLIGEWRRAGTGRASRLAHKGTVADAKRALGRRDDRSTTIRPSACNGCRREAASLSRPIHAHMPRTRTFFDHLDWAEAPIYSSWWGWRCHFLRTLRDRNYKVFVLSLVLILKYPHIFLFSHFILSFLLKVWFVLIKLPFNKSNMSKSYLLHIYFYENWELNNNNSIE